MIKKLVAVGFVLCACAVVLTTCRQESMVKKLQSSLLQANIEATKFFGYNPDLELVPTQSPHSDVITISAHGYGANKKTGKNIAKYGLLTGHVLTLNLPDHDFKGDRSHTLTHGTIAELLPFMYALKTALHAGAQRINVYGFSAGGGVIVNVLGILHSNRFDNELASIGITQADKVLMLKAIEQGVVLLDVPLKSIEEIIALRGHTPELAFVAQQYKENDLRPLDTLSKLQGLKLRVLVYFENPDDIIFNQDDAVFIERLERANALGTTRVVFGCNGGHNSWHKELWSAYAQIELQTDTTP